MKNMKKILSFLLAASLVLSCVPVGALAAEDGLCAHHPWHTEDCGYVETVEGHDCEHVCGEDCWQRLTNCVHIHGTGACTYVEAQEGGGCTCGGLVHTAQCASVTDGDCDCAMEPGHVEGCGYSEDLPASGTCDHTACTEESGCVTSVEACVHAEHDGSCGYVQAKGAPCKYVCQDCAQKESEVEDPPTVQTVDFMEYLDDTIPIIFQSGADIDLHDYLVNAYEGLGEIPFTCSPAVVSYGEYEDGSLISVTVTAGEGYEGSCSVNAEVRYIGVLAAKLPDITLYSGDLTYGQKTRLINGALNQPNTYEATNIYAIRDNGETAWADIEKSGLRDYDGGLANGPSLTAGISVLFKNDPGLNLSGWEKSNNSNDCYYTKKATYKIKNYPYALPNIRIPDMTYTNTGVYTFEFPSQWRPDNAVAPEGVTYANISFKLWKVDGLAMAPVDVSSTDGKNYTLSDSYLDAGTYQMDLTCSGSATEWMQVDVEGSKQNGWTKSGTNWEKSITFEIKKQTVNINWEVDESKLIYDTTVSFADAVKIKLTGSNGENVEYTLTETEWLVYYYTGSFTHTDTVSDPVKITENSSGNYIGKVAPFAKFALTEAYAQNYQLPDSPYVDGSYSGGERVVKKNALNWRAKSGAVLSAVYDGNPHSFADQFVFTDATGADTTKYSLQYQDKNGTVTDSVTQLGTYSLVVNAVCSYPSKCYDIHYTGTGEPPVVKILIPVDQLTISFSDTTYTGNPVKPVIVKWNGETLTDFTAEYTNNVEVGTATVKLSHSAWSEPVTKTFEIKPRSVQLTGISVADKVYDGTNTAEDIGTFEINGILEADKADIKHNAKYTFEDKNVGKWSVAVSDIALGGSKAKNYSLVDKAGNPVTAWTASGTISPKPITVKADDLLKTYGATDPKLTYTAKDLVSGDTLAGIDLSRETGETVGSYEITVTEETGKNPNYTITTESGTFKITERELTVNLTVEKQFDNTCALDKGKDTFVYELEGVVGEDSVGLNAEAVNADFATANVGTDIPVTLAGDFTLTGDDALLKNYTLKQPADVTGTIYNTYNAENDFLLSPDSWTNGDVTITAKEGFLLVKELTGQWSDQLTYADQAESTQGNKTAFYVKNADGDISILVEVPYFIDRVVPTGSIALKNRTAWQELVSNITFGMFFNYQQTVTITGEDALSGVEKIEYLESDAALTQSDLDAAKWTEYREPVPVSLEDAKRFVYYAKITDKAGNVTYLSTDGSVYDTTDPVITISGETKDHVYYTTQKITVSDANALEVTLNDQPVSTSFDIPGDVTEETTHIIEAKDPAGNTTKVTMTMLPISTLDDKIEDLTTDNATSAELEEIQEVLDTVKRLLEEDIPEAEQKKLKAIQSNAQALKKAVEDARAAIDNSVTQKVADKTEANVKLEDQADLEAAKKLLDEALKEENKGNYTPAEQTEIRKDIQRLEKAIAAIKQTKAVIEAIGKLPDTVETDLDEKTEKAIHDAKAAYDQLTDHQKSLIDKDEREKLEDLLDTLVDYRIIRGLGKWEKGSGRDLRFTANGPDRKFKELRIDGRVVRPYNYYHREGSTIIVLKARYLDTLSTGKYRVQVVYTDGETSGRDFFRVYNSGSNPSTGDGMNLMLAGSVAVTSLLCLAAMAIFVLRNKEKHRR